ncbi:hypothetical protein LTR85_003294 [Meristemomyces frigidus]|nr:hypothetical protein LTR85_003294 [Meristemomyces frigidus]
MSTSAHTTTNPGKETPSTSETSQDLYPKDSIPAADVSNTESKVGMTTSQASGTMLKLV